MNIIYILVSLLTLILWARTVHETARVVNMHFSVFSFGGWMLVVASFVPLMNIIMLFLILFYADEMMEEAKKYLQ